MQSSDIHISLIIVVKVIYLKMSEFTEVAYIIKHIVQEMEEYRVGRSKLDVKRAGSFSNF